MKKGQNGSSWTSERSMMFGGNGQNGVPQTPAAPPPSLSSQVTSIDGVSFSEGDLLLQALNGFVLVVTAEGYVFYTSPTIQDFLGFHQSDVIHQSVFELIHTDDRAQFRRQLHFAFNPNSGQTNGGADSPNDQSSAEVSSNVMTYDPKAMPPENSSFLERNFCCRFRCLLDNSSGFLALNFHGRLKFVHGQNRVSEDGTLIPPQLALFAIATPMQPPSILEIRAKTVIFQSKHKLDFTPLGIDTRGKLVLGYSEVELCMKGSGYNFIHAADMLYCADNHLRMMKTGESGFTFFRLLTKSRAWVWVQANARLVFKGGKPDFVIARQRPLTNEEGEEQLRQRRLQLPFNFATGEGLLYDVMPTLDVPDPCSAPKQRKLDNYTVSDHSLLGCMLNQDQSIYSPKNDVPALTSINDTAFTDSHATVSVPGDIFTDLSPKPAIGSLGKPEGTVQDMIDALRQILEENDLVDALDVAPDELKSWESTLLKMSTHSCELSEELNDILNGDILSYVEEQLQREGGLPDQLDDIPNCLSGLDFQNPEQNFSWDLEPQGQLVLNGGPMMEQNLGMMKLSHLDLPQESPPGLNGPTLLQISAQQTGLQLGPGPFSAPVMDSCGQTQNQIRTVPAPSKENNLGGFPLGQTNQIPSKQMAPPLQMRTPPISLKDQHPGPPVFTFQGNQWTPSISPNPADGFKEPPPANRLQGHFPHQNGESQRPPWPLEKQLITSRHQQMGACLNQIPGFQRNPLPADVAGQNAVSSVPLFRTPETSNGPFTSQQSVQTPPVAPASSCRFSNVPQSVPVNGVHLSQVASCQRLNPSNTQMPPKPSCFYQGLLGGGTVPGMTSTPNGDEAVLSCQMNAGLIPGQQQFLAFSEQTQINGRPILENGGFSFSALPNGNTYYSENK